MTPAGLTLRRAAGAAALLLLGAACGPAPLPGTRSNVPVVIIGIDGADWDRMEPMMRYGRLPHLAALAERGAVGRVAPARPALSPLLWTTVATGRPPDEHGVLDFVEYDAPTGQYVPVTGRSRKVKALWNMADDAGLSSVVVGWWATWPAEQIRGAMVADRWSYTLLTLRPTLMASGSVAPASVRPLVEKARVEPSRVGRREMARFVPMDGEVAAVLEGGLSTGPGGEEHPVAHLRRIVAATRSVEAAARALMEAERPDLTMVYFQGIDEVGHRFARYESPPLPGVDPADADRYGGVMDAFYRFQDEVIGRLVEAAGPDAAIMVLSDHGFARGGERPVNEPADLSGRAALWHVGPGILLMAGGPVIPTRLGQARLVDIAPTALAMLGLPVAEEMSGGPLRAALGEGFLREHPIAAIVSYEQVGRRVRRVEAEVSAAGDDAAARLERLKSLGYLDGSQPPAGEAGGLTPGARINLATVLAEQGKTWEAESAYRQVLAADPDSLLAHRGLFDLLRGAGRTEAALEAGRRLLAESREPSASSFAAVAELWVESGQIEAGRAFLAELPDRPGAAGIPLARGLLAAGAKDQATAEAELREALRREPGSWDAAEAVFRLFEAQGRLQDAMPLLRQGLAAHGGDSVPHLIAMGYIALLEGDLTAARDYLTRAEEEAPGEVEVQLYLGSVDYRSGRYLEAVRAFTRVLEEEPEHLEARANLILALGRSGRIAQALEAFREAGPEGRGHPRLLNAAAYACLLNGLPGDGLPLVERSLAADPASAETRDLAAALRRALARPDAPPPAPPTPTP